MVRFFLIGSLLFTGSVEAQGTFHCIVIEAIEVSDVGSAKEHVIASLLVGEAFLVDRRTGRHNLSGVGNSSYGEVRVIDHGSKVSAFKVISVSSAVAGTIGSARNVEFLTISTFNAEPYPFLLTEGTSKSLQGLCQWTD